MIDLKVRYGARIGLVVAVSATAAVVLVPSARASSAPSCPGADTQTTASLEQDIDADHLADLAVGIPSASVAGQSGAGALDIRYAAGADTAPPREPQRLDARSFGLAAHAGDRFGSTVAMTSLSAPGAKDHEDACSDLVIGVPGANDGAGLVIVARGSKTGVAESDFVVLRGRAGDRFGSAIATDGGHIFVGAPGRTVNGQAGAGAVDQFDIEGTKAVARATITQNTAGVGGTAEAGDAFGSVLRRGAHRSGGTDHRTLIVGVPAEDVGAAKDAGIITVLQLDNTSGSVVGSSTVSQNTAGISGTAETGDRFGAAVDYDSVDRDEPTVAVGAPGEDLGADRDGGSVQLINAVPGKAAKQFAFITQDSPSVSGTTETGDQFGATVLFDGFAVRGPADAPKTFLAVGAPGEDLGTEPDAGAVSLLEIGHPRSKPRTVRDHDPLLFQGQQGVGSRYHAGNHYGAGLSSLLIPAQIADDGEYLRLGGAALVVAAPGDDLGATDAGTLCVHGGDRDTGLVLQDTAGATRGEAYGVGAVTPQSQHLI